MENIDSDLVSNVDMAQAAQVAADDNEKAVLVIEDMKDPDEVGFFTQRC